jgi:stage IV sporulation protein FB
MRDPMSWSIPLFRAFGIQVKLHILYIIITLGMLLRIAALPNSREHLVEFALIWVVILFTIILIHEFGHCFAARRVDGEADEILMWPLGGLAFCAVPHTPRANFITAAGGPLVNVFICLGCGAALFAASYLPPINIFQMRQLYYPELHDWKTGNSGKPYADAPYFVDKKSGERFGSLDSTPPDANGVVYAKNPTTGKLVEVDQVQDTVYPTWILWTARVFWMSWMLLLFNLIPAFPLDGGRLLQAILWGRSDDYRSATQVACWSGLIMALVFLLICFWFNDAMLLFLALFMMFSSYQQLMTIERTEDGGTFGYDFSKGYGGFGPDDDTPAPRPKRVGPIKRWIQARRSRKLQKEVEQRAADESRLDELLDKISRTGKESLTPEERRFMDRVSARYRNRP